MAIIEVEVDQENDLTIFKVRGDLEPGQLKQKLDEYYSGTVSNAMMIDLSSGSWAKIPVESIKKSLESLSRFEKRGRKSALVLNSDADFGIGRMIESVLTLGDYGKQVECFRSREKAFKWIREE